LQVPRFDDVGKLLCAARKKLGLSQEQFAAALGLKLSRLQKWESGSNEPRFTIPELRRIRQFNRELLDAMISGFLPLDATTVIKMLSSAPARHAPNRPSEGGMGVPSSGTYYERHR
jgi:transcriptional regulator with XRE-family HTH domain